MEERESDWEGGLYRPREYDWERLEKRGIWDMGDLEAAWAEQAQEPDPDDARDAERDGWFD